MRIIEIKPLPNGGHRNQTGTFTKIPEGFALIPGDLETANFPFGDFDVEIIDGIPTVTNWVAGVKPEPESEPESEPSADDILNALLGVEE